MEVTEERTYQMKQQLNRKREQLQDGNINLIFGQLLFQRKEYTLAQAYFQILLEFLQKSPEDLGFVYHHLGEVNMRITNWNGALAISIKHMK